MRLYEFDSEFDLGKKTKKKLFPTGPTFTWEPAKKQWLNPDGTQVAADVHSSLMKSVGLDPRGNKLAPGMLDKIKGAWTKSGAGIDPKASALGKVMGRVGAGIGNLIGKAHQIGQDILRDFDWGKLNPVEIELGFRFDFPTEDPLVIMRGFMDMITEEGYIIDHKSAGKRPTKAELAVNPQLLLYVWAYEKMYGKKPVKVFWHHLRTAELIEADVLTDYDAKLQTLVEALRVILADTEYPKQPYGYFCTNLCSYHDLCWSKQTNEKSVTSSGGIEGLFQ